MDCPAPTPLIRYIDKRCVYLPYALSLLRRVQDQLPHRREPDTGLALGLCFSIDAAAVYLSMHKPEVEEALWLATGQQLQVWVMGMLDGHAFYSTWLRQSHPKHAEFLDGSPACIEWVQAGRHAWLVKMIDYIGE